MSTYIIPGIQITSDYLLEVSRGNVPNASGVIKFGKVPAFTGSSEINYFGALTYLANETNIEVLSSSENDTDQGDGAWEVTIELLDDDFVSSLVNVTLNGTTPVTLDTNGSTLSARRINRAFCGRVGSTGVNAGNITIRVASAGSTQAYIPVGYGQTAQSAYTVPSGYIANYVGGLISAIKPTGSDAVVDVDGELRLYDAAADNHKSWRKVFLDHLNTAAESNAAITQFVSNPLPAGTDVRFKVTTSAANTIAQIRLFILLSKLT